MKKKLLMMMLTVVILLVGCGNADNKDTEANTQQTESQSTSETETLEADTEEETTTEAINIEVESETSTQTESETPQPSEEPSEPQYTYTDLNKTMYAKSSVNVRSLPSTDGEKLGGLSKGQEVSVTGQCNETGWYRINYNGGTGYVSSSYLVDAKPVGETPTQPSEPSQPSGNWYDNYEFGVWHDMGEYYMYIDTKDNANAVAHNARNTRMWEAELLAKYPDRQVMWASSGTGNPNINVAFVSATIGTPGEAGFYRPTYIWE